MTSQRRSTLRSPSPSGWRRRSCCSSRGRSSCRTAHRSCWSGWKVVPPSSIGTCRPRCAISPPAEQGCWRRAMVVFARLRRGCTRSVPSRGASTRVRATTGRRANTAYCSMPAGVRTADPRGGAALPARWRSTTACGGIYPSSPRSPRTPPSIRALTGLAAVRPKVSELLPRQGIPPHLESWDELAGELRWGAAAGVVPGSSGTWSPARVRPVSHGGSPIAFATERVVCLTGRG